MVESIKNLAKSVELPKAHMNKTSGANGASSDATSAKIANKPSADSVDLSGTSQANMLADYTKSPPIDMESVTRIKEAIANGEYPIDLDAVADMLLDAYKDMKS